MNRAIAWFAANGVAANLLMVLLVVGGIFGLQSMTQEIFPEISTRLLTVTVPYPGAAPAEVEESICTRVEEAIHGLASVKRITSTAQENVGVVRVELLEGEDVREALDDVKSRVDAIDTFPDEAEEPVVQEVVFRRQVINVAVSGPADEKTLKVLAERTRDELGALPGITQVEMASARPYEISIEVSEDAMRRYGLTFDDVANAVRRTSLDLPGGSVRSAGGEILLRTKGQAYHGREFEDLMLLSLPDGTRLRLGDVATVVDGFAETDQSARFDGQRAVLLQVFRVGDQSALDISKTVKDYIRIAQARMPEGIRLTTWQDDATYLRGRLHLLLKNGAQGLVLVFLVLWLFLGLRLSFWVSLGIPLSFLGALWLAPHLGMTINLISLFAFIVVLGIVVDDAIVVGESIYTEQQGERRGITGAIAGAQRVAVPVIFGVLTTIAAFVPLLSLAGQTGQFMRVVPIVVIPVLVFSLCESMFVLPSHLSHQARRAAGPARQRRFGRLLATFVTRVYRPVLDLGLRWRYGTLSLGLSTLILAAGLIAGGWVQFTFFPPVEADDVAAMLTMPQGTPADETARAVRRLEESAEALQREVEAETGMRIFQHVLASVGEQPFRRAQSQNAGGHSETFSGAFLGEVHIALTPSEVRPITSTEIANRWREKTGPVPDAVELLFSSSLFDTGDAINVQLTGGDLDELREAAGELKQKLQTYPAVFDVADSFRAGKKELKLGIRPSAEALGLTLSDLARQVRQGFYGEEAQRIQRGRDDVKVMVRYPASRRRSLGDVEAMRIRLPGGTEVPFSEVATASYGRGYAAIQRADRRRAIQVTADVDETQTPSGVILQDLQTSFLPRLLARHPALAWTFEGEQREQRDTMGALRQGFVLALFLIFALLAVPLRSYIQPAIIMTAIPFGLVGAVLGHMIMGLQLTIMSMFGLVALAGVVVNDSLVLVDTINRHRAEGMELGKAVRVAGDVRFRPILLTSLTTFAGLTPLILERSVQAKFLIPMAVSLAFGVMFSTFISLMLVPAAYLMLEDFHRLRRRVFGGGAPRAARRGGGEDRPPPTKRSSPPTRPEPPEPEELRGGDGDHGDEQAADPRLGAGVS